MHSFTDSKIKAIALHGVGNKSAEESLLLSAAELRLPEAVKEMLRSYFTGAFKLPEYFNFCHDINISMNEVFVCAGKIFDRPETLLEQSVNLARHLYGQSVHPKIKGGEFYTAYFQDCIIGGETVDAVGLFKSENKDTFLKVYPSGGHFEIESEKGININRLDKGCLIFNTEKESGYVAAVVDNTNKGVEAQYWIDDFLHVRRRRDEYYNTQQALSLCKNFVREALPQQFEVSKVDQAAMLDKSIRFFKEKDNFNLNEFAHEVMEQPDVIQSFNQYKSACQEEYEIDIPDDFAISDSVVKKQARVFKSVIKLDRNFHIYVHGNRELIEQGSDERGRYYKIYYRKES
jgi:hypothetical protein